LGLTSWPIGDSFQADEDRSLKLRTLKGDALLAQMIEGVRFKT